MGLSNTSKEAVMKTINKSILYMNNDKSNIPSGTVVSGETFVVETELATGDWLHDANVLWSPEKTKAANPCVCIYVEDAEPGDTLMVKIEQIVPNKLGYMAIETHDSVFPRISTPIFGEIFAHTVTISEGFIQLFNDIKVPVQPMIGTIGTTLDSYVQTHIYGGHYGGNMDIQEVCEGAIIHLPVFVKGALLNVGDVHARQSDGELSAVEVASEVKLTVQVKKRKEPLPGPRIENDQYLMTAALQDVEKETYETAFSHLLNWLVEDYPYSKREAYILLGAVMEARCTRYLGNENYSFLCKVDKKFLTRGK
jgi:amidase